MCEGGNERLKDSSKLLGFDKNRTLWFHSFRTVDFPLKRKLTFDSERTLDFDSDRDLPFGKKGVSFRHFICGNCGNVVDGEVARCPGCRAKFRSDEKMVKSTTQVELSEEIQHSKMKQYFGEEYEEQRRSKTTEEAIYRCGSCGRILRFIRQRGMWYCDRCKIYIPTTTIGAPRNLHKHASSRSQYGTSGVKFIVEPRNQRQYPSEVVIVDDLRQKRRS
jgi:predicted RNA-binding Zn-ribbon protein involved in translation (DUF1610 family)